MNELEALVFLSAVPQVGSVKIRLLTRQFGTAAAAAQADAGNIAELPGFGPKVLEAWTRTLKEGAWKHTLDRAAAKGVEMLPYTDARYPKRLLEIVDFPIILYVKGSLLKADQRALAVVGTRHATIYGREMAEKISAELAAAGFTIVSGLARGIDTAAHQGALQRGRTIAVMGSGFDHIYPRENSLLAELIVDQGALISEFPMHTPPDRQHFPQRNRIVSGMTLGTLLIEAPRSSGAMVTVEKAIGQGLGRKIFALPGRVDQETFGGNHFLIKSGAAELIENAADVLAHFDNLFPVAKLDRLAAPRIFLEPEEEAFIRQLPAEELTIDQLVVRTQLPIAKLNVLLVSLVLKRAIKEYPGKIYRKI